MLQVLDDDGEEEEAAPDLVCRSRRHLEMVSVPTSQPAEDPPIVEATDEQARRDQVQPTVVAGRARRWVFSISHRASDLYVKRTVFHSVKT